MIKLTPQRQIIYNIFKQSKTPLSAEMIYNLLEPNTMNLSTVYRSIDYFFENDLILKFHFNHKSYYFLNTEQHHHYFICTNCLKMNSVDCHLNKTITKLENEHNLLITNHEMTFYGLCSNCQKH